MASLTPYGTPGVNVPSIDYSKATHLTTKTYHGLSILVNGNIIGRIQAWTPAARTRTVTHKWELSANAFGRPVDLVPGKAEGYSISIQRTEVWEQELEIVCGYGTVWSDLMDQNYPFVFNEQLAKGTSSYRAWQYPACWFTSVNEEGPSADAEGIYQVSAEIAHLPRIKIL